MGEVRGSEVPRLSPLVLLTVIVYITVEIISDLMQGPGIFIC